MSLTRGAGRRYSGGRYSTLKAYPHVGQTDPLAALGRLAFDPEFAPIVQDRPDAVAGVDPAAIGPVYLDEPKGRNGVVVTDSGVHTSAGSRTGRKVSRSTPSGTTSAGVPSLLNSSAENALGVTIAS